MQNKIILVFDDNVIGLAGYEYGQQVYEAQVEGKIDIQQKFQIEIPSNIRFVASSFVQGFFSRIVGEIGFSLIEERAEIICDNSDIQKRFLSKLI